MLVNAALCWDEIVRHFRLNANRKDWQYYSTVVNHEPIYDINKYQYAVLGKLRYDGYIEARIDGRIIRDVSVISWGDGIHVMLSAIKFGKDLLAVHGYSKIVYACVYNNPIYRTLHLIGQKYGARYVGTFCAERMAGGKMRDVVYWEIHRNDFMRKMQAGKISRLI